eukprot:GEMP01064832.1.p2 GENE.GEMP01064832.1~~GEMP01064832.1.p2  ORF type:complete len:142 (+),score=30.29 GEMP01064832.1:48-473(+)
MLLWALTLSGACFGAVLRGQPPGFYSKTPQGEDCRYVPPCADNLGCTCYVNTCLGGIRTLDSSVAPVGPRSSQLGCECCHRSDGWSPGMFPNWHAEFTDPKAAIPAAPAFAPAPAPTPAAPVVIRPNVAEFAPASAPPAPV